jgi:hypothetical protein
VKELSKAEWQALIPDLKNWDWDSPDSTKPPKIPGWKGTLPIDVWIERNARYDHFAIYARILWAEFIEHDDCVFFAKRFNEQNYHEWRKQLDKTGTETMLNHTHITDLCHNSEFKPNREIVLHVGRTLKEIWNVKLTHDFPNRKFTVSFPEHDSEDLVSYEVTFFQESHS